MFRIWIRIRTTSSFKRLYSIGPDSDQGVTECPNGGLFKKYMKKVLEGPIKRGSCKNGPGFNKEFDCL
jgi:hypothetical protein